MRRKIITIDKCMTMRECDLKFFIENYNLTLNEGCGHVKQSNIDFKGMTIKDIAQKYDCEDIDNVFIKIKNKLNDEST